MKLRLESTKASAGFGTDGSNRPPDDYISMGSIPYLLKKKDHPMGGTYPEGWDEGNRE